MRTKYGKLKKLEEASQAVSDYIEAPKKEERIELLPSGCDIFNIACSGKVQGFTNKGVMINIVGDSDSGKTFLAMTILASIFYKFGAAFSYVYLDYERAVFFSISDLFGKEFAETLNYVAVPSGREATLERWFKKSKLLLKDGKPTIIVTDSFDNLSCYAELRALEAQDKAKDGKEKESIGMQKAKAASQRLGKLCTLLADTSSVAIIISQVRDKPPTGFSRFPSLDTKTRNGGHALRFFSSLEIWLAKGQKLGKNRKRPIGGVTRASIKRSRLTGKVRSCSFPILYAYGVDNTRASIMFLVEEEHWKVKGQKNPVYDMKEFGFTGKLDACVDFIEEVSSRKKQLRNLVVKVWEKVEETTKKEAVGKRKPKFPN